MGAKGCQEPRVRICPEYDDTFGGDAAEMAGCYGLSPDPWQALILDDWLARGADGKYAAKTCGLSVPRQNGKNALIEMRELYGLTVEGEKILHTAHEVKSARKAFLRLCGFFEDAANYPELAEMVVAIRKANGQEAIVLNNGASVEFSARTRGAARGFTVDVIVCDEAQELKDEELEALLPASSAAPLKNSQLILTGTPPGYGCPGDVFKRTRKRVLSGEDKTTAWHEWSVTEVGDVRDMSRVIATNPALGYRLTEDAIAKELATMSPDGFARERLGWWSDVDAKVERPVSMAKWRSCEVDTPPDGGTPSYGIKFSLDGSSVSVSVCVDGGFVECLYHEGMDDGIGWLITWLAERWRACSAIVIDGKSGSKYLHDMLLAEGVSEKALLMPRTQDVIAACSAFKSAIDEGTLAHCSDEFTDRHVCGCAKRRIGTDGGWAFAPVKDFEPSVPESLALSMWGALNAKRRPGRKLRIG